jgi:hypothetical protein
MQPNQEPQHIYEVWPWNQDDEINFFLIVGRFYDLEEDLGYFEEELEFWPWDDEDEVRYFQVFFYNQEDLGYFSDD